MTATSQDLMGAHMPALHAQLLGQNPVTATATGTTQGTPKVKGGQFVRVTTATSTTAVTLDSTFAVGQDAWVVNVGSVTGVLFPPTSGTLNGGSANASISIPAGASAYVTRVTATDFRVNVVAAPPGTGAVILGGATDAVTAFAGGGQTSATQLTGVAANVTVVATAADSVKLPLAQAGMFFALTNQDAADSMQVFGAGTDTINGVATATGVAQAAGKSALYFATTSAPAGKWFRILSA